MKLFITALLLVSSFSTVSFAQTQSEYTVAAIKGPYLIIGQKPYKMLQECPGIQEADKVTFTSDPITCQETEVVDLVSLSKCPVICITNEQLPPEYQ